MTVERAEIAIVGAGPAGAVLGTWLARAGHDVVVLERAPAWRWHACGVFTSPATLPVLRRAGLSQHTLDDIARPLPAMRVETPLGTAFRLTYGTESGGHPAIGFDRSRLDPALIELARQARADVRQGRRVVGVEPEHGVVEVAGRNGESSRLRADVVVGADGLRSIVARVAGVVRTPFMGPRVGLTYHHRDPDEHSRRDARMIVLDDGYVGIAPVASGRVNVGIVLGERWRPALASRGAAAVVDEIVAGIRPTADDPASWRLTPREDAIAGASPLGQSVSRRAGRRWLLVGDAAGFLDPFTGEGLHRALVSAELAAGAIHARSRGHGSAFAAYERAMHRRFLAKDGASWLVQAFLGRPVAFEYAARRLATRSTVRATMGLVMGDLAPPTRVLDPRYLARLLAP
ncbi:MAG TPA: NAD(P)/FAD-dependent oxidoreductase [Candidatus Limnocylindrales bacterium]